MTHATYKLKGWFLVTAPPHIYAPHTPLARRTRLQEAEADLMQNFDETMQEMHAQVCEHFDSLVNTPIGTNSSIHNPSDKLPHSKNHS